MKVGIEEFVYTLFLTGLRIGEIGALKSEDVDWKNKCIHVNRSLRYDFMQGVKQLYFTSPKTINSYCKIPFMGGIEIFAVAKRKSGHIERGTWE